MIRVLIVDDEGIARSTIKYIIEYHFPQIEMISEAYNGKSAVEKAREMKPDIVIMDIEMPLINGIEASSKIKELLPKCAIIFLTAFASFTYAKQAISLGVVEYLLKPIVEDEMVEVIKRILKRFDVGKWREEMEKQKEGGNIVERELQKIDGVGERSLMVIYEMRQYIDNHYMDDISVEGLADQFQISPNYFSRIFRQTFHISCKEYITTIRVEKAKEYLASSIMTVSDIGNMVGYSDPNYFTKVFRKKVGMTPKEYRNEQIFLPND